MMGIAATLFAMANPPRSCHLFRCDRHFSERHSRFQRFSATNCADVARVKLLIRRACSLGWRARELGMADRGVRLDRPPPLLVMPDRPQLSVALRMRRLRTIYRAENIGNVLKRVVNVCQREFVNEVLGPLVTEFVCNFGREHARTIQHAFHGGLLDAM